MNKLTNRPQLGSEEVDAVLAELRERILNEMQPENKGQGVFVSQHEALGVLTEEYHEVIQEVRSDFPTNCYVDEMFDVAIVAVWAIASNKVQGEASDEV